MTSTIWQFFLQAVASRNNDRTVPGKSFAWRLLGMMPSISKAETVLQTEDWRSDRRTRLYHYCIDILVQQINYLSGQDIHFWFWYQLYWRSRHASRVFLDFLCMDGNEVSNATMCPTTQCTTCWCPKAQLSDADAVFPFRKNRNTEAGTFGRRSLKNAGGCSIGMETTRSLQSWGMLYQMYTCNILELYM
jgi:hypothetical protein